MLALPGEYPGGFRVRPHHHSRAQLLLTLRGVAMVETGQGRWMVPPNHALWIPPGLWHAVEMVGDVSMRSVYLAEGAVEGMPTQARVLELNDLTRALIVEASRLEQQGERSTRTDLVMALLREDLPGLPERPLKLPLPVDPHLVSLCREFLAAPDPHLNIEDWAGRLGLSRRSFTRVFRRETGLGLSAWRQQALVFAALPRLVQGEAVTTVALDLRYESVAAFTTMFRRTLGLAPRLYIQRTPAHQES